MRVLISSIVSGTRKDGPRRPPTCGAALLIALVVLLARSAHTHTLHFLLHVLHPCWSGKLLLDLLVRMEHNRSTSARVCQSTDRCCPQSPTFQSTSTFHLLRSPFSSIHHRGSLTLRGWYGCIDPMKTHADRSSLFGLPDVWCVPPTKPSVSSMHPINPAMWRYHVVRATHSTW